MSDKVISKEEMLKEAFENLFPKYDIDNYVPDQGMVKYIYDILHTQSQLDSNVEEAIEEMNMLMAELENYVPSLELENLKLFYNVLKQALEDKDKHIKELNDTLEITVIAEMLDLIKNGTPIPLTRKQLQSKLNAIEEVVKESKFVFIKQEYTRTEYVDNFRERLNKALKGEIK